jgi:hypothetical protein
VGEEVQGYGSNRDIQGRRRGALGKGSETKSHERVGLLDKLGEGV